MTEQLIQLCVYLLIGVGWVWGVHCCFQEGNIFYPVTPYIPDWLKTPLYDCPPCASSIQGSLIFFLSPMVHTFNIFMWPVYLVCLCGVNYIIKEALYE